MEPWARAPLPGEGASERAAPEADMAIEREREEKTERVAKREDCQRLVRAQARVRA